MASCFYTLCSPIIVGCKLYQDNAATTPVINGFYSDGTNCYQSSGGSVISVSPCPANVYVLTPGSTCALACNPPAPVSYIFGPTGNGTASGVCGLSNAGLTLYSASNPLIVGSILYTTNALSSPFNGGGNFWHNGNTAYQISGSGVITTITPCPVVQYWLSDTSETTAPPVCDDDYNIFYVYSLANPLVIGSVLYTTSALTTPYNGGGRYRRGTGFYIFQVSAAGVITDIYTCAPVGPFNANTTFEISASAACTNPLNTTVYTDGQNYFYDAAMTQPIVSGNSFWHLDTNAIKTSTGGLNVSTTPCGQFE